MLINKIVLWVHPDWHTHQSRTYFPTHRIQETLREEWAANILRLSNEPETLLVCFPSFSIASFGKMLQNNQRNNDLDKLQILLELIEREMARKQLASNALGHRYLEIQGGEFPTEENFIQKIYTQGFSLSQYIAIESYGEYFHICVRDWGKEAVTILSRLGYSVSVSYNEELSLNVTQRETIDQLYWDHTWSRGKNNSR